MRLSVTSLLFKCVSSLLGVDPSIPEKLVQAIKERIVIPTILLEISNTTECTSLDGPNGFRGSGSSAVGGFTVGNFYGVSLNAYFQAIGRLVAEVHNLAELTQKRSEISSESISGYYEISDFLELSLKSVSAGFSGRLKFSGILQGLLNGHHVWWCIFSGEQEISDHCGYEISVFPVNVLRFFPSSLKSLEISINFRLHNTAINSVLIGKHLTAQYTKISAAASVISLAEASARKMRYKDVQSPSQPIFKVFEFLTTLNDASVQGFVEKSVLVHLTTNNSLEKCLLNDVRVMRKYAEFIDERNLEKFRERSKWGSALVEKLKEKEDLESLNASLLKTLTLLKSL